MTKGKTLSSKLLLATGIISAITGLLKTISDIVLSVVDRVAPRPLAMPEVDTIEKGLYSYIPESLDTNITFAQIFNDYWGVGLLLIGVVILVSYIIINNKQTYD